jgi:hypothetical protein
MLTLRIRCNQMSTCDAVGISCDSLRWHMPSQGQLRKTMDESHVGHLSRFRITFCRSRIASSNDREMDVIVDINIFYRDLQARWVPRRCHLWQVQNRASLHNLQFVENVFTTEYCGRRVAETPVTVGALARGALFRARQKCAQTLIRARTRPRSGLLSRWKNLCTR